MITTNDVATWDIFNPATKGEAMKFEVTIKVCVEADNMEEAQESADILVSDISEDGFDSFTVAEAAWDHIGQVSA